MKNIFLIIIIIILASGFALSQKGSFSLQCNPDIHITIPSTPDDIRICPGCKKDWNNGNNCLYWSVTTTTAPRKFQAIFHSPAKPNDIKLNWWWMYQVDSGPWKDFSNKTYPPNKTFTLEGNSFLCVKVIKFRVCITHGESSCTLRPGNYNYDFSVDVNCVN